MYIAIQCMADCTVFRGLSGKQPPMKVTCDMMAYISIYITAIMKSTKVQTLGAVQAHPSYCQSID